MTSVAESYAHCERIARSRAKNFYYSFLLLPKQKRLAMCAVYAYMRRCDDLSDEEGASLDGLGEWRANLEQTLEGSPGKDPIWPAFLDTVRRYTIPPRFFREMLDGVSSDLSRNSVESFEDLYRYCYLVASVVGLTVTHIFEFEDPKALELAEKCGIAFQLTNILRDVREDAANGRIYLPQEDLRRFGVNSVESESPALKELLRFEGARARRYYEESRPLIGMVHEDSRAALWALMEIYSQLLTRLESEDYPVLEKRVRLSTAEKLWILARAGFGRRG